MFIDLQKELKNSVQFPIEYSMDIGGDMETCIPMYRPNTEPCSGPEMLSYGN